MFGPGEYVPDPTEGIVDVKDLPAPQRGFYSRNHQQTPCPDVASSPLATHPTSAPCTILAIYAPVVQWTSS